MIINIVAGGPIENLPDLSVYTQDNDHWIGVDRGLYYLLKAGIKPLVGIGDFDSVTIEELQWMKQNCPDFEIAVAEKDQTDNELALEWALKQNPMTIRLFGGTGGRIDHGLANIQLLYRCLDVGVKIEMLDKQNSLSIYKPGTYLLNKSKDYKYISLIPFTMDVKGITLEGFKYSLTDCDIKWGTTFCISNEIIKEIGTFSFNEGILILVKSKD